MAKFFLKGKWKKHAVTALSVALSLTFSMGLLAGCNNADNSDDEDDDDTATSTETDNQLMKNGNFEFYSDKDKERDKKTTFFYTPTDWSFTSGSPSSDARSGIINLTEWDDIAKSKFSLVQFDPDNAEGKTKENADKAVAYAVAHWDEASSYDRLEFLKKYDDYFTENKISTLKSDSEAKKLFDKFSYTCAFADVEDLDADFKDAKPTAAHDATDEERKNENSVLMIHNDRTETSSNVLGTGQYYTGPSVTLESGTAAEITVSVRTDNLTHYYAAKEEGENKTEAVKVESRAGAYVGVSATVGGTTVDDMQVKNVITNGNWKKYTFYVKGNSYATTTFRLKLGLGISSTDNRYEAVNGYAFFDDVECKKISAEEYESKTFDAEPTLGTKKNDKTFAVDGTQSVNSVAAPDADTFGYDLNGTATLNELDLHADTATGNHVAQVTVEETYQLSGTEKRYAPVRDNRGNAGVAANMKSIAGLYNFTALQSAAEGHMFLPNILKNDFDSAEYPFDTAKNLVMLLSTNGAPYTATVKSEAFAVPGQKDAGSSRMLVSFWVKTSAIRSGASGAGVTLVDGENETSISAFDSTTVSKVDIDDDTKDIYDGWVRCFFFVSNDTDAEKTFYLKLTYGATAVDGTAASAYCDGYAAFANFQVTALSKTEFSYASTGDRAKTVSLTGEITPTAKFDDVSVTSETALETKPATPVNFHGVQGGSKEILETSDHASPTKAELEKQGFYTGLLNAKYADGYKNNADWGTGFVNALGVASSEDWWQAAFRDNDNPYKVANQPLVIYNGNTAAMPSYGYSLAVASISANTTRKISMRVKLSKDAEATVYLIDASEPKKGYKNTLAPVTSAVTYWYDDEGNICKADPTKSENKGKKSNILFYKQENGLYKKADGSDDKYYANLARYTEKDEDGNLVLSNNDKAVAYYYNKEDGKFYAYYDKDKKVYSVEVNDLLNVVPEESKRYVATDMADYATSITVKGNDNEGWTEITFYVAAGDEAKSYRLEIWAGTRDYDGTEGKGIPAGAYFLFDDYKSADETFAPAEIVKEMKKAYNAEKNYAFGDEGYLGENDNLKEHAVYSAFTLYDNPDYIRYDATLDEKSLGDPHGSYKQSSSDYAEKLIALNYVNGNQTQKLKFIDYSAFEKTVAEDDLGGDDTDETPDTTPATSNTNVWLIVSSGVMAGALLFAIAAIIVRRILQKHGKLNKRAPKQKKSKAVTEENA